MIPLQTMKEYRFAEYAHRSINQLRKYTNEPYIVHPVEVANIVSRVTDSPYIIGAALLHDTIEDVPWVTKELLSIVFTPYLAELVDEVTDVSKKSDGNRAIRKDIDLKHLAMASPEGQTIKLADLLSNTGSIVRYDPGFAVKYMREKRALLEVLTKGDKTLYEEAKNITDSYFLMLEDTE